MKISIEPRLLPLELAQRALTVAYRFLEEFDETASLFKVDVPSYVGHGYNRGIRFVVVLNVPLTPISNGPKAEITAILEIVYDTNFFSISYQDRDSTVPLTYVSRETYRGVGDERLFDETEMQAELVFRAIRGALDTYVAKAGDRTQRVSDFAANLRFPSGSSLTS